MDSSQINELKTLFDEVICSTTKKSAEAPIKHLEFKASSLSGEIEPYSYGKLFEAINYAKSASGQTKDKAHWKSCAESAWSVFESRMKKIIK